MSEPFTYPSSRIVRRHAPAGYTDYTSFKPWLRDDFTFRCVFCLIRERMYGGKDHFAVEHLKPKSSHSALICKYDNLVYACSKCNSFKGEFAVLDPCHAAYAKHLRVKYDGTIDGLTPKGRLLIRILRLDRDELIEFRREIISMITLARADPGTPLADKVRANFLRYPSDMPDLRRLLPSNNNHPDSVDACYFARAERGELEEMY